MLFIYDYKAELPVFDITSYYADLPLNIYDHYHPCWKQLCCIYTLKYILNSKYIYIVTKCFSVTFDQYNTFLVNKSINLKNI